MLKDFSWGIVAAAAVGVLLLFVIVKIISPSLPAKARTYIPSSLQN